MQSFLTAAKFLVLDLASTIVFLVLLLLTENTVLSVAAGAALGVVQIAVPLVRRKPVHTLGWLSLFLVLAGGTATIVTNDPRFMLFKPSAIYAVIGLVMLKAGWLSRYLPRLPATMAPDVIVVVGYAWAVLMFLTAAVNAVVAVTCSVETWGVLMLLFGIVSKAVVFVAGFLAIRLTTGRRVRAMSPEMRAALL